MAKRLGRRISDMFYTLSWDAADSDNDLIYESLFLIDQEENKYTIVLDDGCFYGKIIYDSDLNRSLLILESDFIGEDDVFWPLFS